MFVGGFVGWLELYSCLFLWDDLLVFNVLCDEVLVVLFDFDCYVCEFDEYIFLL